MTCVTRKEIEQSEPFEKGHVYHQASGVLLLR